MYDLINGIIGHVWDNQAYNGTEQQIIYYISGVLIVVLVVVFIDLIYRIFSNFWKRS